MKKTFILCCFFNVIFFFQILAQEKGEINLSLENEATSSLQIKWKLKENKDQGQSVLLKLKNKSGKVLAVELTFGFYRNGVLEEKAEINACLKNSIFNNIIPPRQMIQSDLELKPDDWELKVLEYKIDPIDECPKSDK